MFIKVFNFLWQQKLVSNHLWQRQNLQCIVEELQKWQSGCDEIIISKHTEVFIQMKNISFLKLTSHILRGKCGFYLTMFWLVKRESLTWRSIRTLKWYSISTSINRSFLLVCNLFQNLFRSGIRSVSCKKDSEKILLFPFVQKRLTQLRHKVTYWSRFDVANFQCFPLLTVDALKKFLQNQLNAREAMTAEPSCIAWSSY